MIKSKALSKVYLVPAFLLCFSSNAAAQDLVPLSPGIGADTEGVVTIVAPSISIEQPPTLIAPAPIEDVETVIVPIQEPPQPSFDQEQIYQTEDLLGDTSEYWDGCYTLNQGWGGFSGGGCPTINNQHGGQINYGYVERTLTNIAAIDQALKGAGLETTGYNYSWQVKNADANYTHQGNGRGYPDRFEVRVLIKDESGNEVYSKTFDYSQYMDWTSFSGAEEFENPFQLDDIEAIGIQITGQDVGYWAGYYGPEFRDPEIRLNYRVSTAPLEEDTTTEDLIFDQMCQQDPLYDMSCPNYQTAMLDQITSSSVVEEQDQSIPTFNSDDISQQVEVFESAPSMDISTPEEVVTSEPIEQQVEEQPEEVAEPESTVAEQSTGTGLNSNQLMALETAESAAAAAQSVSAAAAQQSSTSGLSSTGGVSADLTSDGVSTSNGTLSTEIASAIGSDTGNAASSTQSQLTTTSQRVATNNSQSKITTGTQSQSSNNSQNGTQSGSGQSMEIGADGQSTDVVNNTLGSQSQTNTTGTTNQQVDVGLTESNIEQLEDQLVVSNSIIDSIINQVTADIIQAAAQRAEEVAEESSEQSFEDQNSTEDQLVEKALSGDTSEEAQAALLGYNPNFRAYQQPQMADNLFYTPKDIYTEAKNYDNPNARFFNGASDTKHREMIRQQYKD